MGNWLSLCCFGGRSGEQEANLLVDNKRINPTAGEVNFTGIGSSLYPDVGGRTQPSQSPPIYLPTPGSQSKPSLSPIARFGELIDNKKELSNIPIEKFKSIIDRLDDETLGKELKKFYIEDLESAIYCSRVMRLSAEQLKAVADKFINIGPNNYNLYLRMVEKARDGRYGILYGASVEKIRVLGETLTKNDFVRIASDSQAESEYQGYESYHKVKKVSALDGATGAELSAFKHYLGNEQFYAMLLDSGTDTSVLERMSAEALDFIAKASIDDTHGNKILFNLLERSRLLDKVGAERTKAILKYLTDVQVFRLVSPETIISASDKKAKVVIDKLTGKQLLEIRHFFENTTHQEFKGELRPPVEDYILRKLQRLELEDIPVPGTTWGGEAFSDEDIEANPPAIAPITDRYVGPVQPPAYPYYADENADSGHPPASAPTYEQVYGKPEA